MVNFVILVFVGGALGAMAAFLLGLVTAPHNRRAVSEGVNMIIGTAIYRRTVDVFELCLWRARADIDLEGKRCRRVGLCRDQSGSGLRRGDSRTEARRTVQRRNGW